MKLYVARHGETEWNRLNKICGRTDSPLTDIGVKQAEELCAVEGFDDVPVCVRHAQRHQGFVFTNGNARGQLFGFVKILFDEIPRGRIGRDQRCLPYGRILADPLNGKRPHGVVGRLRGQCGKPRADHALGFDAAEQSPRLHGNPDRPSPHVARDLGFTGQRRADHQVVNFSLLVRVQHRFVHTAGAIVVAARRQKLIDMSRIDPRDVF